MVIYHQNNVAAYAGQHVFYTLRPSYQLASWVTSKTSAGAAAFYAAHFYYSATADTV